VSAAEIERRRNEIMQAFLAYRRQDAFELLAVPEEGSAADFERQFLDFARRFAPWRLDQGGPERLEAGMQERARDLFLAGARAFAELMDVEQRNTLLFRRRTLREERARKPAASFAIKTDLLDAESQYKKGKALLDGEKYREALLLLEFAADCDPQNGLYAAELAHCRFLSSSANAGRALKELAETLRRDPNCGLAAYYAGEIERQAGDPAAAEAHLRRAIKLMSPDRRPIEALKALSSERRR
jgi:tetratricopeptide (TPR) repeat protein